ncbi:hypothetical protein NFI96_026926 [Prochilodus magdalenae]|nr:hypothetical protein NFI96_026926 [Prochilodus magdalenae]
MESGDIRLLSPVVVCYSSKQITTASTQIYVPKKQLESFAYLESKISEHRQKYQQLFPHVKLPNTIIWSITQK